MVRQAAALFLAALALTWGQAPPVALDEVSPRLLEAHVSFLASDELEGRATPSSGLETAAAYIASRFRAAGLEPVTDGSYYQKAPFVLLQQDSEDAWALIETEGRRFWVSGQRVRLARVAAGELTRAKLVKIRLEDPASYASLTSEDVGGQVVIWNGSRAVRSRALAVLGKLRPAAWMEVRDEPLTTDRMVRAIQEREARSPLPGGAFRLQSPELAKWLDAASSGEVAATVTLRLPEVRESNITPRNVAGLLRGSDPVLRDSYVLVTAHYDHIGHYASGDGDLIFNGANDDASGVAALLELARVLAAAPFRPKRSILFMTYFGEELGLLGSQYYARNPLVPLHKTVFNLNLEQLGRTDADGTVHLKKIFLTGGSFTDFRRILSAAATASGTTLEDDAQRSAAFFASSDNVSLARKGIPAHTVTVGYLFPDYHAVGDHWDKLDYENMAHVTRTVARALTMVADNPEAPEWNRNEPGARPYAEARDNLPTR